MDGLLYFVFDCLFIWCIYKFVRFVIHSTDTTLGPKKVTNIEVNNWKEREGSIELDTIESREKFANTLNEIKESTNMVTDVGGYKPTMRLIECEPDKNYPYHLKKTFFDSKSERKLYEQIKRVLTGNYDIYPHVKLDMIAEMDSEINPDYRDMYFSKINKKSIDYLIVDCLYRSPKLGIEVDGPSHLDPKRQANDIFKDKFFKVIGIPLVRFDVSRYTDEEVEKKIWEALNYSRV